MKMRRMFFYGIFSLGAERAPATWEFIGRRAVPHMTLYTRKRYGGIAFARPRFEKEVHGCLYDVPDHEVLGHLDATEGHPNFYRRIEVCTTQGEICEMYVMMRDQCEMEPDEFIEIGAEWTFDIAREAAYAAHLAGRRRAGVNG